MFGGGIVQFTLIVGAFLLRLGGLQTKARYIVQPYRKESRENALETLRKYNTVILVDDSGSMSHGNPSRWQQVSFSLYSCDLLGTHPFPFVLHPYRLEML